MVSTSTQTATKTFARLELIKSQIRIAIRRTTDMSLETLKNTFDKGIDNRWIDKITIYGLDDKKCCRAQLIIEIDWDEYNLQMAKGKAIVSIDGKKWQDDTAIELDELINVFNMYVSEYSLKTWCNVSYPSSLDGKEVMKQLNLVDGEELKWSDCSKRLNKIPELQELRIGCYLAED
jgi:hypothetical protein